MRPQARLPSHSKAVLKSMNDYPQLREMGILHPGEIEKFFVNSVSRNDVLRIVYARSRGSLLPVSRTYKFPRIQTSPNAGEGIKQTGSVLETDPRLRLALDELRALLDDKGRAQDTKETIFEELEALQEEVAVRLERMKKLVLEQQRR